ncbi:MULTISPECIES: alpha-1,2-fucosyltransferase [unclassified Thermosynechococcus]|uniref:alpha-1,2-fucosyltransferase n=1 Tax=unclassified Thermosynechococcus TaxID=2622553 RepID=UPI001CEDF7DE|nr:MULTISPECIES: alpha-1,2-fucosyltransferase [unclassified Thermosynechococcus]WNC33617.1 alpha-1,2-fucosyltransferase [Thermosynechococcus sp. PKX95]WNC36139.1 alpha-1,2-fucosyltransferase [Thermosynechococcus sp. PKX91]WNC38664.1 alpha-1,2-fucosyltransferase [Thermosynechococcus sp. WL11]WNC41183.1 alpha-1,2-fucosyltransferase [Thermosynechococcus sp. WL17]WNC43703.1 alpha-1,2-fucosyltransferase [Thermosynechococcus sp. WL15]
MMIFVNLIGGLGNQMFQYAVGRALSMTRGVPLRLDISDFASYQLHQGFELHRVFCCEAPIASLEDLKSVLGWWGVPKIRRAIANLQLSALCKGRLILEPHYHYWEQIHSIPSTAYLQGYWQSEKYFSEIADVLREDFKFRQPLSEINAQWADKITQCHSISLHIRRGDYVSNPMTHKVHGVCQLDYYYRAIEYITSLIDDPVFFVFSDEAEWAKSNLEISHPVYYVENNTGQESYNDMRLMSLCRHHIIANSTFSWWGAWLNNSPEKIVIAPQKWFATSDKDDSDLIPKTWIRI